MPWGHPGVHFGVALGAHGDASGAPWEHAGVHLGCPGGWARQRFALRRELGGQTDRRTDPPA